MDDERPLFILAGNGPYANRGCEAIVRGTTKILRAYFQNPKFVCLSHFQNDEQFRKQGEQEIDDAITHLASQKLPRENVLQYLWKPTLWKRIYQYYFNRDSYYSWIYREMIPYITPATAILSVGGDNYSLDYGIPVSFNAFDDLILAHKKPLAIWGASIGPFNAMPDYERYMSDHLQGITGIFARESATYEYLKSLGVTRNVYPVADPAFLMDPVKPAGIEEEISFEEDAVGLNLSPLMAKYVTEGNLEAWVKIAASTISKVAETTEMPVYLIPHVTIPQSDDYAFMKRAFSLIQGKSKNIILVSPKYTAAETKWIICQMSLFAGARTHATIAALSSGVPTLSFAYSIKAQGINQDIFGHLKYCLDPANLQAETVAARIVSMLDVNARIRNRLEARIPEVQKSAMCAGSTLKQIVTENMNA